MRLTPAMQQYMDIKQEYPDALILFRMGDFYETFYDDAQTVSRVLGIALTARGKGEAKADLAGIPFHALEKYIGRLVSAGHKVAICEQMEDPKKAKGIVKREVVRVITPGTVIEDYILQEDSNNFIASVFNDGDSFGLAVSDISTGEFHVGEFPDKEGLVTELERFAPSEIVLPNGLHQSWVDEYMLKNDIYRATIATHRFFYKLARQEVQSQFNQVTPAFLSEKELAVCAAGALISYLKENQKGDIKGISKLRQFQQTDYMVLDPSTLRNLEVTKNIRDQTSKDTLMGVMDHTCTAMGTRILRQWMLRPILDIGAIRARHTAVGALVEDSLVLADTREILSDMRDIQRLATKVVYATANARDLRSMESTLDLLPDLKISLEKTKDPLLTQLSNFPEFKQICEEIDSKISQEPPLAVREGGMIKEGVHQELDQLRSLKKDTKKFMANLEAEEIEKTGITSLKIKYNRTFGYFFEVTNKFKDKVPDRYIRKQTLTSAERYITEELKTFEEKLLSAEDKIKSIEYDLFMEVLAKLEQMVPELQNTADEIGRIDVLCSFATAAKKNRYIKPEMSSDFVLDLESCRHPVVEQIESGFVANDCHLNHDQRFMIITGPNMSGKSTYMRQVALCSLLAQVGSFVPAKKARLGIVDRIFTRVGAHDDLSQGQSTFMVEMMETANILNNATQNSLIVLDEIGRGTSTYDGTAIAWSVAEDIIRRIGAKALFATHYHVLTKLAEHQGAFNMNVAVEEEQERITFLHSIIPGATDRSYGIHVARLAGVPPHVLENAENIQIKLESEDEMHQKIQIERKPEKPQRVAISRIKQNDLSRYIR
ncbi:MAG: DNA mismatch repair protein MutS [Nanoarchaeota archaeon]